MEDNKSGCGLSFGGIGFSDLLAIVFIVLKLTGVISWSWLWVLAPIWISTILAIILIIISAVLN
jgi:hypothetical protein